jgi:hypothetical protein
VVAAIRQKKTTADVDGNLGTVEVGNWIANKAAEQTQPALKDLHSKTSQD